MKIFLPLFIAVIFAHLAVAQKSYLDSLDQNLKNSGKEDTSRVKALNSLADYYGFIQLDSCLYYAAKSSTLARKLNYAYGEYITYLSTFHGYNTQGNYPLALQLAESEKNDEAKDMALAIVYSAMGNADRSKQALERLLRIPTVSEYSVAAVYAYRGEKDLAFQALEAAYQHRNPDLLNLKTDPLLKGLRTDQRYRALLRRMNLPESP